MQTAKKIVRLEFDDLQINQPPGCSISLVNKNDVFKWQVALLGPDNSPYEGRLLFLSFSFPHYFPFQPPLIKFITPVYHLNVSNDGSFSLPSLSLQNWIPTQSINFVILEILSLLKIPDEETKPMNENAACLFYNNREKYFAKAREVTREYAILPQSL